MNPNKALWEKGDFTCIAEAMRESGEALVEKFGITKGLKVLDLGCGDGTTAIPAAQRGADVLGVDIAANLVAAGNRRAQALGLANVRFQEGDACDLQGVPDKSFDLLVSIFGAMFAPRPLFWAASKAFMVGPLKSRKRPTSSAGVPAKSKVKVSRTKATFAAGTPAAAKRSATVASTPQVIGLTKPSGGGGVNDELIFRICATSVGSLGIQLPMMMRPPGRVTRTISFATSNGLGANIAPKMLTSRSKLRSCTPCMLEASPS